MADANEVEARVIAITDTAEHIVSRELDRLEARLRADARRFSIDAGWREHGPLRDFLSDFAAAHDGAAKLIGKVRVVLRSAAGEDRI